MKKFLFTIAAIALGMSQASAQTISFGPLSDEGYIEVPQGGQATVAVQYTKDSKTIVRGYKFTLTFPDEYVNTLKDSRGYPVFTVDSKNDVFSLQQTKDNGFSALPKFSDTNLDGEAGNFGTLVFEATADAEIGSTHLVKVSNAGFTIDVDGALQTKLVEDFTFTVKIVDNRVTLDEAVGVTSETPTGEQDVLVKRTIKAGNWNTICLPFAMTADQVKAAFGEGVQLADFNGCESDGDKDNPSTSIKVKFNAVDAIEANHPYLIKVESALTEFRADAVTISPDEAKAIIQMDKSSGRNPVYNSFVGTYNPSTIIPVGGLFLNSNKFYYSNGNSKLKAFRAYFDFAVSWLEEAPYSEAKISITVDGDATSINGIGYQRIAEGVYDLSGRKIQLENGDLNKLQKGVYIIDGKKVTIK